MTTTTENYKCNNVLLIDDNHLDNFINEKIIESANFSKNVSTRTNGLEALDYVNNFINLSGQEFEDDLDCVFVDLNMPLMGGFEFITQFKLIENKRLLKCKIVILTSSIAHEDKLRSQKMDPEIIFINKPLNVQFLNSIPF